MCNWTFMSNYSRSVLRMQTWATHIAMYGYGGSAWQKWNSWINSEMKWHNLKPPNVSLWTPFRIQFAAHHYSVLWIQNNVYKQSHVVFAAALSRLGVLIITESYRKLASGCQTKSIDQSILWILTTLINSLLRIIGLLQHQSINVKTQNTG